MWQELQPDDPRRIGPSRLRGVLGSGGICGARGGFSGPPTACWSSANARPAWVLRTWKPHGSCGSVHGVRKDRKSSFLHGVSQIAAARRGQPWQKEQANKVPGIVVSVDGSAESQRALEWAVTHAALEHAPLMVLAVHRVAASAWTGNPIIYPEDRPEAQRVLRAAEEAVAKAISKLGDDRPSSVTVRGSLGQTGHALTEASHDADMVVLGARGGFARLMPGSVRAEVVNHAACPVVVISGQR